MSLWVNEDVRTWREALAAYGARIAAREVNRLPELDRWYCQTLIPDLGKVAFRASYYLRYADALQARARVLTEASPSANWSADNVARALWATSSQG